MPANKRKIEKTNLAPGGFDQFVTTVGNSAFAFGAPLPSGAVSSNEGTLNNLVNPAQVTACSDDQTVSL